MIFHRGLEFHLEGPKTHSRVFFPQIGVVTAGLICKKPTAMCGIISVAAVNIKIKAETDISSFPTVNVKLY